MKKVRLALFGCGFHSRRIYLPFIIKSIKQSELVLVVDLKSNQEFVKKALQLNGLSHVKQIYLEDSKDFLISKKLYILLQNNIKILKIDSCIISTEPLSHFEYLKFAILNDLNVLVDKPLTLRRDLVSDSSEELNLVNDYRKLLSILKNSNSFVSCMAQRRYHPAIDKIKEELIDCYNLVGAKPNSIFIQHADGQFRTPLEVKNINYHGYNDGYGKCGHSGYHFFDLSYLYASCFGSSKDYDSVSAYSNFLKAHKYSNYINSLNIPNEFKQEVKIKNQYGEVDATVHYNLESNDDVDCSISLSLLHNSFSARNWVESKSDLYKGNGRLRHETHIINIGPFMTIYYFSFQGNEFLSHLYNGSIGDEGHSELHIFRNKKLLSSSKKSYENIKFDKTGLYEVGDYSRGHQEYSRWLCFDEFIQKHYDNNIKLRSNLYDHFYSVFLLNLAYKSQNKVYNAKFQEYV